MIATTAQTISIEDSNNSNKIKYSRNTSDINLSVGDYDVRVEDTLAKSSKRAPTAAQFIDCNANKDLGNILCHKTESLDPYSRKPNNPVKLEEKI